MTQNADIQIDFREELFPYQHEDWCATRDLPGWCIFFEQGLGKSCVDIVTAAWKYKLGEIDGYLIVAPEGVHRNWITEEIPRHMPSDVLEQCRLFCYHSKKAKTKKAQAAMKACVAHEGLSVMAMTYNGLMTDKGRKAAWEFLSKRRVHYTVDEGSRIKNPGTKTTKRVIASGRHAVSRRVLNGTPVTNSPFDVYSQLMFVDPEIWKRHGIQTYLGFKTTFGIWQKRGTAGGGSFEQLLGYQHMDRMKRIVDELSTRRTKDQELPGLPPKLFTVRTFEMEPKQAKMYEQLRDEFITFTESGELVTANMALVRLQRLQQIACGYVPPDDDEEPVEFICDNNPRLAMLAEITQDLPHQCIIWARYKMDCKLIADKLGDLAVEHHGDVDSSARAEALDAFKAGDKQFIIATPDTMSTGHTLTMARTVIYYSNSFSAYHRSQSEDRAHRIGQEHPVNYIDLVAEGTVDRRILQALKSAFDIASKITGDQLRKWL